MNKREYIRRMHADEEWAPGWDAIDREFDRLYPGIEPVHLATDFEARAILGGDNYLDGFSLYPSGKGYYHIVTYGMSMLYADKKAFGQERSGWGYELTMKLKEDDVKDCIWALNSLNIIARYTFQNGRPFRAGLCIPGNGTSLRLSTDSAITGILIVNDTTAQTQDTLHGRLEFLQLVGLTHQESMAIKNDKNCIPVFLERISKDNPELLTDMHRTHSYL